MTLIYFIKEVMKIPIVKPQMVLSVGKCLGYVSFYPQSQKKFRTKGSLLFNKVSYVSRKGSLYGLCLH